MYDLLKNATNPYKIVDSSRPIGWHGFLKTLAVLNVPLSTAQSPQARQLIIGFKSYSTPNRNTEYSFSETPVSSVEKKGKRLKRQRSPNRDANGWLKF